MTIPEEVLLSICIPTYNRSEFLVECLSSVLNSVVGYEHEVEIVISDNASSDDTEEVVRKFQKLHKIIKYNKNTHNIGGERNFRHVATLGRGKYIWVFGDDDVMEESAVGRILTEISSGYCLIVCNYSVWDKRISYKIKSIGITEKVDHLVGGPNRVLECFGLHLGYISSIIIKKSCFLKLSLDLYEKYVEYGFPFMFAVYNGVIDEVSGISFVKEPIIRNRGENSGDYDWCKYFVTGSSLIFDELKTRKYTKNAIEIAKEKALSRFVLPNILGLRANMSKEESKKLIPLLFGYYKNHWRFWVIGLPKLLAPLCLVNKVKKIKDKLFCAGKVG